MDGTRRADIRPGLRVSIVLKKDQQTGKLTEEIVAEIITNSSIHPHGIKYTLAKIINTSSLCDLFRQHGINGTRIAIFKSDLIRSQ